VSVLTAFLKPRRRLLQQSREIRQLKQELAMLRAQNTSMREGMRRCVTCEYRIEAKSRQGQASAAESNN